MFVWCSRDDLDWAINWEAEEIVKTKFCASSQNLKPVSSLTAISSLTLK